MKTLATIITFCTLVVASAANGCDEQCLREAAESKNNVEFPTYLTWKYCDDIRMDFMTSSMTSLEKYRSDHFDTRYKGGMRNIKSYIEQRKEWLQECDTYLQFTRKSRIFEDDKTTDSIFAAMDKVTKELDDLIAGVTYSSALGQDSQSVINERFDLLFKEVDDHKTLMHLKGRYVTR